MSDVLQLFTELAAVASPPGRERPVADRVARYLRDLGLDVAEDGAAEQIEGDAGNLFCRLPPAGPAEGVPIFLCAHLDTVPPEGRIEPTVEDGVVRNGAGTILGADNKAAVAVMLDAARRLVQEQRPHAGLELVFTPKEEVGLKGAATFDHTQLHARLGYVYDQAGPIGEIVLGAPHAHSMHVQFHGRAAHSGMYPEEGRSAIAAAARAIADFRLGRVDEESSANVGTIEGGTAGNIIPEFCSFLAEARSHDEEKLAALVQEMMDAIAFAAGVEDCQTEIEVHRSYRGYRFRRDDPVVSLAAQALTRSGYEPTFALSGGGADANVFNERGVPCLNLANGMAAIHTPDEHIAVEDLERMVDVTLALVEEAAASAA